LNETGAHQATPAAGGQPKSELAKRVLSSLALAGFAFTSVWFGGMAFAMIWGVAALAVWREWATIVGLDGRLSSPVFWIGFLGITASVGTIFFGLPFVWFAFVPAALAGFMIAVLFSRSRSYWVWSMTGPLYAASIIIGPLVLRNRGDDGLMIVVWLFLVVWISDIGAFFAGRTIGGPKLWPSISPKKTWSGSIGGLLAGTIIPVGFVLVIKAIFGVVWLSVGPLIVLTLSTAITAEGGDLFESAMKRRFNVKDSGDLIPGHGGMMDRLDSYVAAALFVFMATQWFGI
jgi:phosphatidate cytidylyltransferase